MNTDKLFPMYYDAKHKKYREDLPFWLGLAAIQGSPILELGCGSGRVILHLAQANHRVVGIDNDAGMLALLQPRISPEVQAWVSLLLADASRIPLAERFSLIVMPCNTLSTLSRAEQAEALREVRSHLARFGVFAVSLPNPELLQRMPRLAEPEVEGTFPHPLTGDPVQVSGGWKKAPDYVIVTWHYDHLLPDGGVKRLTWQVRHRLDSLKDYLEAFNVAGLQVSHLFGGFDRSAYTPDSEHLVILARPASF